MGCTQATERLDPLRGRYFKPDTTTNTSDQVLFKGRLTVLSAEKKMLKKYCISAHDDRI